MDTSRLTAEDWRLLDYIVAVTRKTGRLYPWWESLSTATALPVPVVQRSIAHLVATGLLVPDDGGYFGCVNAIYGMSERRRS